MTEEGFFEMGDDGDLSMKEEEVLSNLVTDTAAPAVEDQEGTVDGVLSGGSKTINADMDLLCRLMWEWEIK